MQVLDDLSNLPAEEGVKLMKQLFNPLRGRHVGYLGKRRRGKICQVAASKSNKDKKEDVRRTPRQMDLFTDWTPPDSGVQEKEKRRSVSKTRKRDK